MDKKKGEKRKRQSCVVWSELVRFWRAASDDERASFLGFYATRDEALEVAAKYGGKDRKRRAASRPPVPRDPAGDEATPPQT